MRWGLEVSHEGMIFEERFNIKARDFVNGGKASILVKGILNELGFPDALVKRASVCAYEAEMNVVMYGSDGEMILGVFPKFICLKVKDSGPGIEDIELAMKEGYSTAPPEYRELGFGAGMGLPNIRRNSDSLEIISKPNHGTLVHMDFVMGS